MRGGIGGFRLWGGASECFGFRAGALEGVGCGDRHWRVSTVGRGIGRFRPWGAPFLMFLGCSEGHWRVSAVGRGIERFRLRGGSLDGFGCGKGH